MNTFELAHKHMEIIFMQLVKLGIKKKLTKHDHDAIMTYGTFGLHYLKELEKLVAEAK